MTTRSPIANASRKAKGYVSSRAHGRRIEAPQADRVRCVFAGYGKQAARGQRLGEDGMSWHDYEAAKAAWVKAHPSATAKQFESAIRRILKRTGL